MGLCWVEKKLKTPGGTAGAGVKNTPLAVFRTKNASPELFHKTYYSRNQFRNVISSSLPEWSIEIGLGRAPFFPHLNMQKNPADYGPQQH